MRERKDGRTVKQVGARKTVFKSIVKVFFEIFFSIKRIFGRISYPNYKVKVGK